METIIKQNQIGGTISFIPFEIFFFYKASTTSGRLLPVFFFFEIELIFQFGQSSVRRGETSFILIL